jgi:hypothetical protein
MPPALDDQDLVGVADGAQPVRPCIRLSVASWSCFSVRVSTLLVASL